MARLRKTCPRCKGRNVASIIYGYVLMDKELEKELEEGRMVLGGCCVGPENPAQTCHDCGHHWGEARLL